MRLRFYLSMIAVLVAAALLVDYWLGKLYVRYMILFSGALFLWGMVVGQRAEQAWMRRRAGRAIGAGRGPRMTASGREVTR